MNSLIPQVAGFTALHIAVFQGGVKTIQHLLDRRRVAWQPQNNLKYLMMTTSKAHGSLTALQIACILEDVECVKVLLKCEDEPRVTNLDYYLTDVYVPSETTAANIGAAMKVLPGSETAKISKVTAMYQSHSYVPVTLLCTSHPGMGQPHWYGPATLVCTSHTGMYQSPWYGPATLVWASHPGIGQSPWYGPVTLVWASHPGMGQSHWYGPVTLVWASHTGMGQSPWYGPVTLVDLIAIRH